MPVYVPSSYPSLWKAFLFIIDLVFDQGRQGPAASAQMDQLINVRAQGGGGARN
jgi:hypothetical protein